MFKLLVLGAVLAVAAAKPGLLVNPVAYSAPIIASAPLAAPIARIAPVAAPIAAPLAVATPIARVSSSVAIPAPVTYTGAEVTVHAEPIEQHGYKIVY